MELLMKKILPGSVCALLLSMATAAYANPATDTSRAGTQPAAATTTTTMLPAQPVPPPYANPTIKRILAAMDDASTYGHPDLFAQFAGMQRLFDGNYTGAMKYFRIGARYADKLSQMSIGMMYLHGRGVSKDEANACAWITLAAERGYPSYVSARDKVCEALSPAQHDQAAAVVATLQPEYGDKVAKQRMKLALRNARNALTGSHLGHDSGVRLMALDRDHPVDCSGYTLKLGGVDVPRRGCALYDAKLWNPEKYFAARDVQGFGTVTVGELQKVSAPPSVAPAKPSDETH